MTANISIAQLAVTGGVQGTLTSGTTAFPFSFTVTPSSAAISSISPTGGLQGTSLTLTVTGANTHWTQADTAASFPLYPSCASVQVNEVTVESNTAAMVNIFIPAAACVGTQTLTMSTGRNSLSGFNVFANTPTVTASPSNGLPGTMATVNPSANSRTSSKERRQRL